jgi:uncharacterized protein
MRFFQVHTQYRPLRLNVGFLLSQSAGYGREFDFQEPKLVLGGDMTVEEFAGRMRLTRTPQGIVAKGDFSAQFPAECARCLKPFSAPLSIHLEDLFVYPPQNATDPLLSVAEDAHLNLEPILREYVLINQPTRLLCREDCRGLCPVCGNDLNDGPCPHPEVESEGMFAERILADGGPQKENPAAAPKRKKAKAAGKQAAGEGAAARKSATRKKGTKEPSKKKPKTKKAAVKAPRKKSSGGGKPSAGGKTAAGGKKKPSKKK